MPTSPSTTSLPPIASALYPRDTTNNTTSTTTSVYYDPTSEHRERQVRRSSPRYDGYRSSQVGPSLDCYSLVNCCMTKRRFDITEPSLTRVVLQAYAYSETRPPETYDRTFPSPVAATFSHHLSPARQPPPSSHNYQQSRMDGVTQSPGSPTAYQAFSRTPVQATPPAQAPRHSQTVINVMAVWLELC